MATATPIPSFLYATREAHAGLSLHGRVPRLRRRLDRERRPPSIRRELHFSVQSLQWVLSAYLLTYGGFMLLGGRAADLLGRRRVLTAGIIVFAVASLGGGLARDAGMLIAARLAQGIGAAMMVPAALSTLTTTFSEGADRHKAIGAWGAIAGLASAAGVFLGGFSPKMPAGAGCSGSTSPSRPSCSSRPSGSSMAGTTAPAAATSTPREPCWCRGMLLLVYALVQAPGQGWGSERTIGELAGAAALLLAFVANERRHPNPLAPLSIFRVNGLGAANATQVMAIGGFYAMFFFITLYMQNVLGYSPTAAPLLPTRHFGVAISSGIASQLFSRVGTRPIIVTGALISAAAIYWLSRIPVHGSYLTDLLPGLMIMSFGLGRVFVGVNTAANAGVPADKAGLAAALVNTSTWVGGALGLAIFSASPPPEPATSSRRPSQHQTRSPPASNAPSSRAASSSSPPPRSHSERPTPAGKPTSRTQRRSPKHRRCQPLSAATACLLLLWPTGR